MRVVDVFNDTWPIYGRRFAPFFALLFGTEILEIPYLILQARDISPDTAIPVVGWPAWTIGGPLYVVGRLAWAVAVGTVASITAQDMWARSISLSSALSVALRRLGPLVGVLVCSIVATLAATLLMFVPGVMVACVCFVAVPACMIERLGVVASFRRSAALTKGYRWRICGVLMVLVVATFILSHLTLAAIRGMMIGGVGATVVVLAVRAALGALSTVIVAVTYCRLRIAEERSVAEVFD